MKTEFEVGDLVALKSGGPRMTVTWIDEDGRVYATWWEHACGEYRQADFVPGALQAGWAVA